MPSGAGARPFHVNRPAIAIEGFRGSPDGDDGESWIPIRNSQSQIEKIVGAGIRPTHLDTHKHTHLLPKVFRAVVRLAAEYRIPYVRLPVDTTLRLAAVIRRYYDRMVPPGVRTTDHFIGFRLTGSLTVDTFAEALLRLPEGSTEFMCHPGRFGEELAHSETRLKESRVRELEALISPRIREIIAARKIRLGPFSTEEIHK